jgi:ATP-dependent Clp protease adaptor protein ClpS
MLDMLRGATQEETKTETTTQTKTAPPWNVIVHDDPISLMSYVIDVLQKVFGYSTSKARKLMLEVHNKGRSVVWTGERERAEIFAGKLQSFHLRTTLERVGAGRD